MVFNMSSWIIVVCIVLAVWSAFLTFFVFRMIRHYDRLTASTSKHTLKDILDGLMHGEKILVENQKKLEKQLESVKYDAEFHVQHIGLIRFNPFSDTGGAQSFTLALLDKKDNGLVMTSLYARTGNRWYIKNIKGGKGEDIELSKEEQMAITKAKHSNEGDRT
jgi:hypothetical protein